MRQAAVKQATVGQVAVNQQMILPGADLPFLVVDQAGRMQVQHATGFNQLAVLQPLADVKVHIAIGNHLALIKESLFRASVIASCDNTLPSPLSDEAISCRFLPAISVPPVLLKTSEFPPCTFSTSPEESSPCVLFNDWPVVISSRSLARNAPPALSSKSLFRLTDCPSSPMLSALVSRLIICPALTPTVEPLRIKPVVLSTRPLNALITA